MNKSIIIVIIVLLVAGVGYSFIKKGNGGLNSEIDSPTNKVVTEKIDEVKPVETKDATLKDNDDKKIMKATMITSKGQIEIEFNGATPNTVANFVKLAKDGFYDGVKFHRVIKGFMIQGGDPNSKNDADPNSWGTGGPGYQFADEITATNKNDVGTISMANAGPNTNGSQFFINVAANNFLDTKHTVFGKVTKGMEVVKAIENTPTGPNDRPIEPVVIKSITIQ